ncbi:MAG: hypothetical protein H7Z43_12165 [Clostridia bacterium]|nr:hypothetical protein [Deltaproteobacteria bacterium]
MRGMSVRLAIVLLLGLSGCARRDFSGLCKLAQEIVGEPRIASHDRLARFVADADKSAYSPDVRNVVITLPSIASTDRYRVLVETAREKGLTNYRCPALEKVVSD